MLPYSVSTCFVQSKIVSIFVSQDKNTTAVSNPMKTAAVVLPSSWANIDVATSHVTDDLFCRGSRCSWNGKAVSTKETRIDHSPIVRDPKTSFKRCMSLWVVADGYQLQARHGDEIAVHSMEMPRNMVQTLRAIHTSCTKSDTTSRWCTRRVFLGTVFVRQGRVEG